MRIIFGRKPVLEAINSGEKIENIQIAYGQKNPIIDAIIVAARKNDIKISQLSPQKFQNYESEGNTQGVVAIVQDFQFYEIDEILDSISENEIPFLLVLDSIQDTHNLGAIFRTAETAGVHGIIMTINNSAPINATVEKTSVGAISYLKIAKVGNLKRAIDELKERNIWVVGSSLSTKKNYTDYDFRFPTAIVVGNEEKGIRKLTADSCDDLIKIEMCGKLQSLNVSVATGILLYEVVRQRKHK